MSERKDLDHRHEGVLVAEAEVKTKRPPFFRVLLLNDDYTPMDFVVHLLQSVYRRTHEEAVSVMLDVHRRGSGVCGVYTRDVAETKADQTIHLARQHEYPLQCRVEQA